eukprot:6199470-Pleurochrysis_carterae.AAC.1
MVAQHYREVLRLYEQEQQAASRLMPPPPPPTQPATSASTSTAASARSASRPSRSRNRGGAINYAANDDAPICEAVEQPACAQPIAINNANDSLPWKKAFDAARELGRTEAERCADSASLAKIRATLGEM